MHILSTDNMTGDTLVLSDLGSCRDAISSIGIDLKLYGGKKMTYDTTNWCRACKGLENSHTCEKTDTKPIFVDITYPPSDSPDPWNDTNCLDRLVCQNCKSMGFEVIQVRDHYQTHARCLECKTYYWVHSG